MKCKAIFGATDDRIACHSACQENKDFCHSCPFNGICENEEYFPASYDGINCEGFIPADYILEKNIFK